MAATRGTSYPVGPFSRQAPGPLDDGGGWQHQPLRNVRPNSAEVVLAGSTPVLRIHSNASASGWSHSLTGGLRRARHLHWRWAVRGAPVRSEPGVRAGDDFAARLYAIFDYPLGKVPWSARLGIRLARTLYGESVPAAALCYIWHPNSVPETLVESPFTSRVRMIVPGAQSEGQGWHDVSRDLQADFGRAFGDEYGPGMPELQAIVISADTDQSGGLVDAFFGDIVLSD
ncbi:MAG: DUF3047 domain-containing protein [Burkholderiaceae bacterium]